MYNEFFAPAFLRFGYRISYKTLDKGIIELLGPYGVSNAFLRLTKRLGSLQTGFIYHYAFFMIIGVTVLLTFSHLDIPLYFLFCTALLFVQP